MKLHVLQEAALAGGAITMTTGRGSAVDFSYPYFETKIGFLSQKPGFLPKYLAILWPFEAYLWIALLIALIGFSIFYWTVIRFIVKDPLTSPALNSYRLLLLKSKTISLMYSAYYKLFILISGSPWPKARSGIILFTAWSLFAPIIGFGKSITFIAYLFNYPFYT